MTIPVVAGVVLCGIRLYFAKQAKMASNPHGYALKPYNKKH